LSKPYGRCFVLLSSNISSLASIFELYKIRHLDFGGQRSIHLSYGRNVFYSIPQNCSKTAAYFWRRPRLAGRSCRTLSL